MAPMGAFCKNYRPKVPESADPFMSHAMFDELLEVTEPAIRKKDIVVRSVFLRSA